MSVRFAGSRRVDERRRRNLANNSISPSSSRSPSRASSKREKKAENSHSNSNARRFPVKKLISQKKWKLSLIGIGLISFSVCFLFISDQIQKEPENWSPDIVKLFSFETGLFYRTVNSMLVFLSAQLTLGIWWARSRSIQDFSGQYRTWFTVALIGLIISFCMATDAHLVFSNSIAWYWKIDFWKQELLGWAVPLLGCATAAICSIHIEFRKNRLSLCLFWFSIFIWGSRMALSFDVGQEYLSGQETLVKTASLNVGSIFLFMSLLFHTQFVLYVDGDPPVAQLSLHQKFFNLFKFRKSKKLVTEKSETPKKITKTSTRKKATKTSPNKTTTAKTASKRKTQSRNTKPASKTTLKVKEETREVKPKPASSSPVSQKSTQSKPSAKSNQPEANPESFNIQDYYFEPGEPLDQGILKGLSKRERRQVRKQWKAAQRAA